VAALSVIFSESLSVARLAANVDANVVVGGILVAIVVDVVVGAIVVANVVDAVDAILVVIVCWVMGGRVGGIVVLNGVDGTFSDGGFKF